MGRPREVTSPSELAEYAFCPRSLHYRKRFGAPPPSPAALEGTGFHARTLRATRHRADGRLAYALIALAGAALVIVAVGALLG